MKTSRNAFVSCLFSLTFIVFAARNAAADLWFRPVNSYSWDDPANWMEGGDTAINRLPTTNDVIGRNSRLISTQQGQALTVTSGTDAVCGRLKLHEQTVYPQTSIWVRVEAGASLTCSDTGDYDVAGLNVGMRDNALLTLDGGTLAATNVLFGQYAGSDGTISNNAGIMNVDYFRIGQSGNGTLVNSGAVTVRNSIVIARNAASSSSLVHSGGTLKVGNYLLVGYLGRGEFSATAGFSCTHFVLGCVTNGTGTAVIANGATGTVSSLCFIGGRDIADDEAGSGTLLLKGGTLRFSTTTADYNLFIRYREAASGCLRGWGTVAPSSAGATNVRMVNDGTVVADGEGIERDLDLHEVVNTTNRFANGSAGTNGWYAVNKGRLLYPRTWFNAAAATRCLGDAPYKTLPEMVNSLCATFTGAPTGGQYFRGGLCALDRSDVPGNLPASERPLGVWCLGLYASNTDSSKASFTNVALTFRYDRTRVKQTDKLKLYRHENGAWVKVGECLPDGTALISTAAPLARLTTGDYNIGWFALLAKERNGTLLSVH
jgi:hypothetical protein